MSGKHTSTPWFHRQAGVVRHGESYDWIADHPDQGRHKKIIVQRHACLPEDYSFIVQAVNSYDSNRATIEALVGALEEAQHLLQGPVSGDVDFIIERDARLQVIDRALRLARGGA